MKYKLTYNFILSPNDVWFDSCSWDKELCSIRAMEKYMSNQKYYNTLSLKDKTEESIKNGDGLIFRIEKA